jgi:uncharacterized repeat protein (TIGR02543 family)
LEVFEMKNKWFMFFGVLLVLCFGFFGCDPGTGGDPTTYTVTFDSNGGSLVTAISGISSGSTISLPGNPTKDAYTFAGWFKDNNTFQNEFTSSTAIIADITVYAKWNTANNQNLFLGAWVSEVWKNNPEDMGADAMAFLFKDDGTVSINGGYATGTYDHNTSPVTLTIASKDISAEIKIEEGALVITGENIGGQYQRGGLLTLTDAPAGNSSNYRFYISTSAWTSSITQDLMTGNATNTIKAFVGRSPGGNDIAGGTTNPIFWNGPDSGTYHVLIRAGGKGGGTWKYKNDVVFVNGKNTTEFGFAEMTTATYTGSSG